MVTKKWKRVTEVAVGVTAAAATLLATPLSALACTQISVGDQLSADGNSYIGRGEDYAPRHPKVFGVQKPMTDPTYTSDESDFKWSHTGTSYRYTYVRDAKGGWDDRTDAYSEAGVNEKGVSVSATESTGYNSKIAAVDPLGNEGGGFGIGEYSIPDVVLGWADSAVAGVKLLGQIVDQQGSYETNQIIISDKNESWIFMQLSGHQWAAIKVPQDKASVNPNMGNLQFEVNVDDPSQCIHSEGLVSTAEKAGSLVKSANGQINIALSYGEENSGAGQNTRYVQGRDYFKSPLQSSQYTVNDKGQVTDITADARQLFFTPGVSKSNMDTFFILRANAARGEGTPFNANTNKNLYSIGNNRTVETHIYQINHSLTPDIATVQWEALSRDEFSISIPSYSALLTEVSPLYGNINDFDESHGEDARADNLQQALESNPKLIDYTMMDINTICSEKRPVCTEVRKYEDAIQKQLIAQQKAVAEKMESLPESERTAFANKASAVATQSTYDKAQAMLEELREWVKAGKTDPMVPSDYDQSSNSLKTPFVYAAALINPTFTQQPAGASYHQGDKAKALTAAAVEHDGVDGASTTISYKWYAKATNAATGSKAVLLAKAADAAAPTGYIQVGEGSSYTPSTDKVGTTDYIVRATNAQGLYTDSDPATVKVEAKAAVAPTTPTTKDSGKKATTKGTKSTASTSSSLAKTGSDVTAVVGLALALAVAGGASIAVRKHQNA